MVPLVKKELDAGEYTLLILQDKYKDYTSTIQIKENAVTTHQPSLVPNFARLSLRAVSGAEIVVDEKVLGTTTWTGTLELGEYVVEVRQAGYRSAYTTIVVSAAISGQSISLKAPTPISGSLIISGSPSDAVVYVDGSNKGITPLIVNDLLIGNHTIRIEKEGYTKQEKTVTIAEGQEAVMEYSLTKIVKPTPAPSPTPKSYNGFENGHEYVDLGLSVKWATCNVGATKPEEYGDYFAWGETTTKSIYNWTTHKWFDGSSLTKYDPYLGFGTMDNKKTLELSDDAGCANWGGNWRMPTSAERNELFENCTWAWTTLNGVEGYKVTSKSNGNSIFLPAAGIRSGSSLYRAGSEGFYWSSSLDIDYPEGASILRFGSDRVYGYSHARGNGLSVRPVCP